MKHHYKNILIDDRQCLHLNAHTNPSGYCGQCDQIGQFIGLWATFKALTNI